MVEVSKPADEGSDEQVLGRLTARFRGDSTLSDEEATVVAKAIYGVDAPRAGNDMTPFSQMGPWDRAMLERKARAAVAAFLGLMKTDARADETAATSGV